MSLAASNSIRSAGRRARALPASAGCTPPGGFAGLSILNGLLRILTLGVYHFWGKTEVRQRIWSAVRIDGEPLEYRGTGGELFRGFLIVFFLILLPMGLASFASLAVPAGDHGRAIYNLAFWGVLFLLSGIGIHRARRYRLSRTRWRGIRGGLSGRSRGFAWTYLWTMLLVPLTLGWILPWRAVRLQKALFNETRFGDNAFTFTGVAGPLYKRFWLVWFSAFVLVIVRVGGDFRHHRFRHAGLRRERPDHARSSAAGKIAAIVAVVLGALLVFAMIRAWYSSRVLNYFAAHTKLQGTGFTLEANGAQPGVARRQQLSHSRLLAGLPVGDHRGALHALHRRPAFLRRRHRLEPDRSEPRRAAEARRRACGGFQCRRLLTARALRARTATAASPPRRPSRSASPAAASSCAATDAGDADRGPTTCCAAACRSATDATDVLLSLKPDGSETLFVADPSFSRLLLARAPALSRARQRWHGLKPGLAVLAAVVLIVSSMWLLDLHPAQAVARVHAAGGARSARRRRRRARWRRTARCARRRRARPRSTG